MQLFPSILLVAFVRVACAQGQNASDALQHATQELPPCALDCMVKTAGPSTCELTDLECMNSNKEFQHTLSACVTSTCKVKEALTTKRVLEELKGTPVRNNTKAGALVGLIVGSVAVLFYILRVIARLPSFGGTWGIDDWVMTAATGFTIPLAACVYLITTFGMGRDMWQVPFEDITRTLEIFYFLEIAYILSIALTKISILLLYLRIFPRANIRKAIWVTILLCVLYIVAFVVSVALQCIPVTFAWTHWDGEHHGRCININAVAWCAAVFNIILDLIVMLLPMRELNKLVMNRIRKFGVMLMFLGGLFITVVSMLRLKYLIQFNNTSNVTWDYLPIAYWSAVEADVGIMVACLPAIRALASAVRNRLFPKPTSNPSYFEDSAKSGSNRPSRKDSRSRILGSVSLSQDGKQNFVRLDEYEMGEDSKSNANSFEPRSLDESPTHQGSFGDNTMPLGSSDASMGHPVGGILVQSEYRVDRMQR